MSRFAGNPNERQQTDDFLLFEFGLSRIIYSVLLYFKWCWIFSRVSFSLDDTVEEEIPEPVDDDDVDVTNDDVDDVNVDDDDIDDDGSQVCWSDWL